MPTKLGRPTRSQAGSAIIVLNQSSDGVRIRETRDRVREGRRPDSELFNLKKLVVLLEDFHSFESYLATVTATVEWYAARSARF